ncbi:hypothetical protein [Sphingobacterium sp. xlx-130]|uniref:hypothetical protein n=1 Tax=Sphingobacterium sp. xlx-130 TaxID=2654323 RepID=UPI0013DB5B8E|nr:hypothetical protein [Sphingobacterium sp. xlx-130]
MWITYVWLTAFLLVFSASITVAQDPVIIGNLRSSALTEVSGITASAYGSKVFWVHNDSGDRSAIYAIGNEAGLIATLELGGVTLVDAEDIAALSIGGISYLLLADMGNNLRDRDTLSLFLFKEPILEPGRDNYRIEADEIREIKFRYKDKRRDAEALFVDPIDNRIYIVSKRDFKSTVFSLSLSAFQEESVYELEPQMQLPFTFVTAADIRQDGKFILIKNLNSVFLWERKKGQDIISTLKGDFKNIPYKIEPQGEAICFDRDDRFFYTISERPFGLDAYLYKYDY